jgi:hypothetical protein
MAFSTLKRNDTTVQMPSGTFKFAYKLSESEGRVQNIFNKFFRESC